MQDNIGQSSTPSSLQIKALLLGKLKQKLKQRVQATCSSTCEISDDETRAASPVQPAKEAASLPEASMIEARSDKCQDGDMLLTRTMQLALANSKKRKPNHDHELQTSGDPEKKKLRRKCLSKQTLALARTRSQPKNPKKIKAKVKAQAKNPAKNKCKASAKSKAKASPKAKARAKGKAKAGPGNAHMPGHAEIRRIHGLKYRQAKAKDGTDFGEVPKEQRGILKKEIRRSKLLLGLPSCSPIALNPKTLNPI